MSSRIYHFVIVATILIFSTHILENKLKTKFTDKSLKVKFKVFNDEGKPSRRAQLKIFDLNDELISIEKTNRKGRFEFLEILPDFYFLHVFNFLDDRPNFQFLLQTK